MTFVKYDVTHSKDILHLLSYFTFFLTVYIKENSAPCFLLEGPELYIIQNKEVLWF